MLSSRVSTLLSARPGAIWRRVAAIGGSAALTALAAPFVLGGSSPANLVGNPTPPCSDQWAMYQHDASHHGTTDCSSISRLTVATMHPAWFVNTPAPVTATPTEFQGHVYVGDQNGTFYDIDAATGAVLASYDVTQPSCSGYTDHHQPSYGEITSSAAAAVLPGETTTTIFVGAGGSLLALSEAEDSSGNWSLACRWSVDTDPNNPTNGMEVESSPVLYTPPAGSGGVPEVIVGSDANEASTATAPPGVQALNAATGDLLWKYEPENNDTVTTESDIIGTDANGNPVQSGTNGCGDVWSSPALDPNFGSDGLVVITTGNCDNGNSNPAQPAAADLSSSCPAPPSTLSSPKLEGLAAIDARTGCLTWRWSEPTNQYADPSFPSGGDTDFGMSPILTSITDPTSGNPEKVVLEGGKSGYMYALKEAGTDADTTSEVWQSQPAQPGEFGAGPGAVGGFIGSGSLGKSDGNATVFGATAIPATFGGQGFSSPDGSLPNDPTRIASLHAVDATSGKVRWQGLVSLPSYGSVTYTNGVIFAPSTTGFSVNAYDADNGALLWSFPTGGSMSSGASIVGSSIFFGGGTSANGDIGAPNTPTLPPQVTGIWSFTLGTGGLPPKVSGLPGT